MIRNTEKILHANVIKYKKPFWSKIFRLRIKTLDIPCKGVHEYYYDGDDFDCEYEKADEVCCDDCICNFGYMNPATGKKINFILRFIQDKRAVRHYKEIKK